MKKFTKLFLSCAAVAAVTAAVATSAMAAEKSLTASYSTITDGTTRLGKVTITCDSKDTTKTLLVLKPGSDKTAVKTADILQIDQKDGAITEAVIPALDETTEADKGTYTVLVGGTSGDIYVGTFTIGATPVLIGDADQDTYVDGGDATAILKFNVGKYTFEGDGEAAADADQDTYVDGGDATAILKFNVGKIDSSNDKIGTYINK